MSERAFLVDLPGARALFSTRLGGVSEGAYSSLNLGVATGDQLDAVERNRALLMDEAGLARERIASARQVHDTRLIDWEGPPQGPPEEADGHTTTTADLGLLVLVADCLPVALAGAGRVAMVHCGWRGLAGGILAAAVERFERPPAAAVGPGVGPCCYEVGEEVLAAFSDLSDVANGRMLDLRAVAEARLREAGVEQIEHVDHCTSCRADLFFSHRRDAGVTGRQGGLAWLTS